MASTGAAPAWNAKTEFFSARLKQQGFTNIYKLQGGVQHYANAMKQEKETPERRKQHPRGRRVEHANASFVYCQDDSGSTDTDVDYSSDGSLYD